MRSCSVAFIFRCVVAGMILLAGAAAKADLVDLIPRIKPSVLLVGTYDARANPRFTFRGTGFAVGAGNIAVTNAHVLPEIPLVPGSSQLAVQVWVAPNQWTLRTARVLQIDKVHDLALLSFEGAAVPALKLASVDAREGANVAFMGFPIGGALGFSHVTHRALVSAITPVALPASTSGVLNARNVAQIRASAFNFMQLDGTAYPGNSGGPVFDSDTGEVVGVINMVLLKSTKESALSNPSGISYAIPVDAVARLLLQP